MRQFIDIIEKAILRESLNSDLKLQWADKSDEDTRLVHASFQIEDGHYIIQFVRPNYDSVWEISFVRNDTLELSGTGHQFKVMAAVKQACIDFISTYDPRAVMFAMFDTEPSRKPLYTRLATQVMAKFPDYSPTTRQHRAVINNPSYKTMTFTRPMRAYQQSAEDKAAQEERDAFIKAAQEREKNMSQEERDAEFAELEAMLGV